MKRNWLVEEIPDEDSLFYRVSVGRLRADRQVFPGVFGEIKGSMSTDWEKYSTAAETRARPGRPETFAVLGMVAGKVREIDGMTVIHAPIEKVEGQIDNRAHTDIFGMVAQPSPNPELGRKERIGTELYNRFRTWEIAPGAPVV
jgi:hypothetical protein